MQTRRAALKFLLPLVAAISAVAGRSQLTVTQSTNSVQSGGTVSLTANHAVRWSLVPGSMGELKAIDSRHATFTAPASIPIQTPIAGCPAMPNDSIYNVAIDKLPVHPQSANWLSQLGRYQLVPEAWSGPNPIVGEYRTRAMKSFYGSITGTFPYLPWPKKREGGALKNGADKADHHTLMVTTGNNPCHFYELYNDAISPTYTYRCNDGSGGCNTQSLFDYTPATYAIPVEATDAANLPQTLTYRLDEIKGNAIHHAGRVTLARGFIQGSGAGATTHSLWPSTGANGWGGGNTPPYGARFRLKPTFDISRYSPYAQVLLKAFQTYGFMVADVGGTAAFSSSSDVWEDPAVEAAVAEAARAVHFSDTDIVDASSLMLNEKSTAANGASGEPIGFAQVIATDEDNPSIHVNTPLALQGVGVGLADPQVSAIVTGRAYSYDFGSHSWVTGTSRKSLKWTLISGPGRVTSAGVYTLPEKIAGPEKIAEPTAVVLKATAAADPNASATQYINLYPASADGHFRVTLGGKSRIVDQNKNIWWQWAGLETGIMAQLGGDNRSWANLKGNPEAAVYQSDGYTYGDDINVRLIVPNGAYRVRMLFGHPYASCNPCRYTRAWHDPSYIGANGQIAAHMYHWNAQTGEQFGVAWQYFAPADVTANVADIWIGGVNPDGSSFTAGPSISALELIPDALQPCLSVDTGNEGMDPDGKNITPPLAVPSGASVRLYAIGWHMSNAVRWSTSGPGSIDPTTGVYSAPQSTPEPQTITVTATSTVDPRQTATAKLRIGDSR